MNTDKMNTEHKHTQGPLAVRPLQESECTILNFYPVGESGSDNPPIAYVTNREDAHLFAAAPDLLQAVEHAIGFISVICELAGIEDDVVLDAVNKDTMERYRLNLSDIIHHATDTLEKVYVESDRATGKESV